MQCLRFNSAGRLAATVLAALGFAGAVAQSQYLGGVFPTIDHAGQLNNKLGYSLYYFGAFPLAGFGKSPTTTAPHFFLFYSEQALTYSSDQSLSFTGSYVYQRANVLRDNFVNENRFYIQAKYKQVFKQVNLAHRLRVDGRFVQNRVTGKAPFTHRLRYLLGGDFALSQKSANTYFAFYEELFFNSVRGASPVYEENWAYAALGKKLNAVNKIELGLLYITWSIGKPFWLHQYYLQATWITTCDFTGKKK